MWKPVHEAHAIERVRLLLSFAEPVPARAIALAGEHVIADHRRWGLDTSERISPSQQIMLAPNVTAQPAGNEGYVFKKLDGENVVEEVGFRAGLLGYMTTTYGRWDTLRSRVEAFFSPAIDRLKGVVDFADVQLEYWDAFLFDGELEMADARDILASRDVGIPEYALGPGRFWHNHTGWFEARDDEAFLVNRNIGVASRQIDSAQNMSATIYSLVRRRAAEASIESDKIFSIIDIMHKISNTVFGETISGEMRERIGLDLREYKR
jgi:uncharacterized protein (TIGR04255 family)